MVEGQAQTRTQESGTLAGIARLSLLSTPVPGWKTQLSIGHKKYLNHTQQENQLISWENRLGTSRHWDLRVSYKKDIAHELGVTTSFYW